MTPEQEQLNEIIGEKRNEFLADLLDFFLIDNICDKELRKLSEIVLKYEKTNYKFHHALELQKVHDDVFFKQM